MKLSVIIPNYNGEILLSRNLPKILNVLNKSNVEFEIIISDDKSDDNSLNVINKIKSEHSKNIIKIILGNKNKGFSTNVNRAVENASGEFLLLLNTDVIPEQNFLDRIFQYFDDEKVFAVGCLDESIEKGDIVKRGRGKGEWKRGFLMHSAAEIKNGATLWVAGGSGFFRRRIWEELGGLDPLYDPFYWEDIDISYRARKAGYLTVFEIKSIVRHEHDKGAIKSKFSPSDIKKIAYRNQIIFAWKNSDFSTLIYSVFWLPYHLLNAFLKKDIEFLSGFISAFEKLPKIIHSRKVTQKYFSLTDKEVTSIDS